MEGDLTGLAAADLDRLLERLEAEERTLSNRRRRLHDRIDFVRAGGNPDGTPANPDQLEALDAQERAISDERKALHARIDAARSERERRQSA